MTYVERYNIPWVNKYNSGYVYIDSSVAASSERLILAKDGITINNNFNDWEDPIIGQTAEITIQNDASNSVRFFQLLPLMSAEEREYRIRINQTLPTVKKLFEGYLNNDIVEQNYFARQQIRLIASNYIKKLEYETPSLISLNNYMGAGTNSLIDLMIESIKLTGSDASINVNMKLCPSSNERTLLNSGFNLSKVDCDLFWKDNINQDSGLDIITKILKSFNSYIYWYNGNWYIERYEDIWKKPQTYVKYSLNASYGYLDNAICVSTNDVSLNIYSNDHLNRSTLLRIIPGYNKIDIQLNQYHNQDINVVLNQFKPLTYIINAAFQALIPLRTWRFQTDAGSRPQWQNAIPYKQIQNSMLRVYWPNWPSTTDANVDTGMYTRFRLTVDPCIKMSLNLNWKWYPNDGGTWNNYDFKVRWFLYNSGTGNYWFIKKNTDYGYWYRENPVTMHEGVQEFNISGEDINNKVGNINISIPLSDVSSGLTGDQNLVFGVLVGKISYNNGTWSFLEWEHYGDFIFTINQEPQDNLIQGTQNSKFLNKKTINLDLYDAKNLNYKNGIFYYNNIEDTRTALWYNDTSIYHSLVDHLMINKYQLYNRSRQQISATISCSDYLKPFSLWKDTNQYDKNFVLTSYSYYPTKNQYDVIWSEYDNTTSVILTNMT